MKQDFVMLQIFQKIKFLFLYNNISFSCREIWRFYIDIYMKEYYEILKFIRKCKIFENINYFRFWMVQLSMQLLLWIVRKNNEGANVRWVNK